jgi:protein involved in polysaccharide export with SLBB domain
LRSGKIFYQLIIFVLAVFLANNFAQQELPNYPERTFQTERDSFKIKPDKNFYTIEATEGSINPDEYHVGPGDKIFISISGVLEVLHNLVIDQEGWLYIPKAGAIDLKNSTLTKAREKIINELGNYYKNVEIFISLVDFRKIKVSLTGDVIRPSLYVLSSNSRLMDLITNSYGLSKTANLRNIHVFSKDGTNKQYDLLRFLRFGDYENNPMLREGAVVIIDKVDEVVNISGEIKYPAIYEFIKGESVFELIELSGGLLSNAKTDTIEIISFDPSGKVQLSTYLSLDELKNSNIYLKKQDHVVVRRIPDYYEDSYVKFEGFVKYPGWYKIVKDSTTLLEIVDEAGGFRKEASLTEASLKRTVDGEENDPEFERLKLIATADMTEDEYDYFKSKSRQTSGRVVIDFVDLFVNNNLNENIVLRKGDIINIPEQKDYIIMLGQFVNPGKIIYDSNLTVNDYISLAEGFGWRALEGEVRIIKAKTGEWIDADDLVELKPGDTIWVPEDPPGPKFWEVFMDGLQIIAQLAAVVAAAAAVVVATR